MIRVVFNEHGRDADGRIHVVVTFIDDSGNGIRRVSVQDSGGGPLCPEIDVACERVYKLELPAVPVTSFPLLARSVECEGDDAGAEYSTLLEGDYFPVAPPAEEDNPCFLPLAVLESGGNPCSAGRDEVNAIADEIEELCAEWNRHKEDWQHHGTRSTAFFASAAAVGAVGLVLAMVPLPWVFAIGLAMLVAAAVLASLAGYHVGQRAAAESLMDLTEEQLADAYERFRNAVASALQACCGAIPAGMPLDPPECDLRRGR